MPRSVLHSFSNIFLDNILRFTKTYIVLPVLFFYITSNSPAQDIPLLSPDMTNSFFYNPALAGSSFDYLWNASLIHRASFTYVSGHPVCDIICTDVPIIQYRFGIGANFLVNRVNAMQTTYGSLAYAFHIPFGQFNKLSVGFSLNLSKKQLDYSQVKVRDNTIPDAVLLEYMEGKNFEDFSFGVNYRVERFTFGGAIINLASSGLFLSKEKTPLFNYYSLYVKYVMPLPNIFDECEPFFAYRQLPLAAPRGDIGVYYSYRMRNSLKKLRDNYYTFGFAIGTNLNTNYTLGVNLRKRFYIMYNYELSGRYNSYLGGFNEIMLKYSLINISSLERYSEYLKWDNNKTKRKKWLDELFKKNKMN